MAMNETVASETRRRPGRLARLLRDLFRTLFFTLLFTGLGMALGLMSGILVTALGAGIRHVPPDMRNAYLHFAIPAAVASGSCALLWNLAGAIRRAVRMN